MFNTGTFLGHGRFWQDGQVMIAAADGSGVFLSIDFGDTWEPIDLGTSIAPGDTFAGISISEGGEANFVIIAAIRNKGITIFFYYHGDNYQVTFYPYEINFDRMKKTEGGQIGYSDLRRLVTRSSYNYSGSYDYGSYSFPDRILDFSGDNGQEVVLDESHVYQGSMYFNNSYTQVAVPTDNWWLCNVVGNQWWLVGNNVIAKSIDNRQTWSLAGVNATKDLSNVRKYNLAGHNYHKIIMLAAEGKVFRCQPNILSTEADIWTDCQLPTGDYYWVDVANDKIGLTAKYGGKIMVTHDNGSTWTEKYLNKNWSRVAIMYGIKKRF